MRVHIRNWDKKVLNEAQQFLVDAISCVKLLLRKKNPEKIQLHFSPHSPQSFFSLTLHVISFNQTFFLVKKKKPDETYRKSYDVYSNRDATRSEIFVSVLSRDTTETNESGPLCITDLFQNKYFQFIIILL